MSVASRLLVATSNPGKLFSLSTEPARSGSYESDIRDAGTVASWGVINPGIAAGLAPSAGIPRDFARFATPARHARSQIQAQAAAAPPVNPALAAPARNAGR